MPQLLGVPEPPKTGRERLVAAAIELFYRHGFAAVGIDRVISAAGVTKTTFYKHFEGKDELMVAAVHRRDEWETQSTCSTASSITPTSMAACSSTPPWNSPTPTTRSTRPRPRTTTGCQFQVAAAGFARSLTLVLLSVRPVATAIRIISFKCGVVVT
ncbi:MAG TPA: TetR/AcrR family transcriptional regulator [Tepidisphaeraceae bacterium]|nr:TetR/AcrR family transcriptional regulator [Tepidisphaeraceae bacterium]